MEEEMRLRAPEPEDIDRLYLWENDPRQWLTSLTPVAVSRQRIWDYVNNFDGDLSQWAQLKLMAEASGCTVGTVDLCDIDLRSGRAFVGIYIEQSLRGKGYGSAALKALVDYSRDVLGLRQLVAIVAVDNDGSQKLFEGAGFSLSGRLRQWLRCGQSYVDALFYQLVF